MFLFRLMFWVGVALLVLPSDEQQQARLYGTVVSAYERATTFCDRNADTCASASEAWDSVRKKAEFGYKLARDLASKRGGSEEASVMPSSGFGKVDSRGTLSPMDMQPSWRGPGRTGA
jgi:hypothetical protein